MHVASDGIHLVRLGPWASDYDQEAVSFFENGRLIRTYRIDELISLPVALPHSVSHFEWQDNDSFDDARLVYTVWTKDFNRHVFDVQTGERTGGIRLGHVGKLAAYALVCALCVAAVAWVRRIVRRRREATGAIMS